MLAPIHKLGFLLLGLAPYALLSPPVPQAGTTTVRGKVWMDADGDGRDEPGETGRSGIELQLLSRHGLPIAGTRATTDSNGEYLIEGVPEGTYRVGLVLPKGWQLTETAVGGRDSNGELVRARTRDDDSDFNVENGYLDPSARGPFETGMRYFELTRVDGNGDPWPINVWAVHPARAGTYSRPKATVGELYRGDATDLANTVAATKHAVSSVAGGLASQVTAANPDGALQDIEARIGAPLPDEGGPYPVVILLSGLLGGVADMVEIGDLLASHGYVALCMESSAFHSSIALGARHEENGGPYAQVDFAHIPQVRGLQLQQLLGFGYTSEGFITGDYPRTSGTRSIVSEDAKHVLEQADAWNGTALHLFGGRLDLARVGWIGFSAGARDAGPGVADERFDLLVNIDSVQFVNVRKPMLWIGNARNGSTLGPSIQADFRNDNHPFYMYIPATRWDPGVGFHRELHHEFRNFMLAAFCGLYLKDVQAYRRDLGLDGVEPRFYGYVRPYRLANTEFVFSEEFQLDSTSPSTIDAGLVSVPLWILGQGSELYSLDSSFQSASSPGVRALVPVSHGPLLVSRGETLVPLSPVPAGFAVTGNRTAWVLTASAKLYSADLSLVPSGESVVLTPRGVVRGLSAEVQALSYDPASGRLLAIAGTRGRELFSFPPQTAPQAQGLGTLPDTLGRPGRIDFDRRGCAWILDRADGSVARLSISSLKVLEQRPLGDAPPKEGPVSLSYDPVTHQLFTLDPLLGRLTLADADNLDRQSVWEISSAGWGEEVMLAFAADAAPSGRPYIAQAAPGSADPSPRALLEEIVLSAPEAGWGGHALRIQVVEGSGRSNQDRLSFSDEVAFGARVELNEPRHLVGEAQELLWQGQVVGWWETDWDIAVGGERLAPLRIVLAEAATTPAVEALLQGLEHSGGSNRTFELALQDPTGRTVGREVFRLKD